MGIRALEQRIKQPPVDDLPWACAAGGLGFQGRSGRVSGVASDADVAQHVVHCVNAHEVLLSTLEALKAAAEHRAEFGCYPPGMGARGLSFEAWVSSTVDAALDSVLPEDGAAAGLRDQGGKHAAPEPVLQWSRAA